MKAWQRAVETRTDIVRWLRHPVGRGMMMSFLDPALFAGVKLDSTDRAMLRDQGIEPAEVEQELLARLGDRPDRAVVESFPTAATTSLSAAPLYAVSRDMEAVIAGALNADELPSWQCRLFDLLTDEGLVILDEPMFLRSQNSNPKAGWTMRGAAWLSTGEGLIVLGFVDVTDDRMGWDSIEDDLRPGRHRSPRAPMLNAISAWENGEAWDDRMDAASSGMAYPLRAFLAVFWRLCTQRIASVERAQDIDRATRRRLEREDFDVDAVRLVTLRRRYDPDWRDGDGEGPPVEWSHRWIVRGHWRWQWYPSIEEHLPIYIADYVKGPPDKELIVKPLIFSVER